VRGTRKRSPDGMISDRMHMPYSLSGSFIRRAANSHSHYAWAVKYLVIGRDENAG
jgi:hypothetical protein